MDPWTVRAAGLSAGLALLAILALPEPGGAELFADLADRESAVSALPRSIVTVGDRSFFTASQESVGMELWVTDGTEVGTRLVLDIVPGASSSSPSLLIAYEDGVVFYSSLSHLDQGSPGQFLWRSDGTEEGTFQLSNRPHPPDLAVERLATLGRRIFFTASEDATGTELWVSRGRPDDARLVHDLTPGPDSSDITFVGALGNRIVFRAQQRYPGGFPMSDSFYITNGHAKGTRKLVELPANGRLSQAAVLGDQLFFTTSDETLQGSALWRTDGTPSGTTRVAALANSDWFSIVSVARLGDRILVLLRGVQPELWSTDGTVEGTSRIASFEGVLATSPVAGDEAIFFSIDPSGIWRSDGTEAGTLLIDPIDPARVLRLSAVGPYVYFQVENKAWFRNSGLPGSSVKMRDGSANWMTAGGDGILFSGVQLAAPQGLALPGFELYTSDGTPEGTRLVKNIRPDVASSDPRSFVRLGDTILFRANLNELWRTDGTVPGTEHVLTFGSERSSGFGNLFRLGSIALFSAETGSLGYELWRSDGTSGGTEVVRDLDVGPNGSNPNQFTRAGERVFFVASEADRGRQLWTSDGSANGTFRLSDIEPRPSFISGITVFEDDAFLIARLDAEPLWRSDGTPGGTTAIPIQEGLALEAAPVANDVGVFFTAFHEDSGYDLWRVSPDESGVELVIDLTPGPEGVTVVGPRWLTPLGSQLFFVADDGTSGLELFVTDGTADGTLLLRDIRPGAAEGTCEPSISFGAEALVEASGEDEAVCPASGSLAFAPNDLVVAGGKLYFSADDDRHGRELWVSDGSSEGTRMVLDAYPGPMDSAPKPLREIDDLLLLQMRTPEHGEELWVSDGTPAGTLRVSDDEPGTGGSQPNAGEIAGDYLLYGAHRDDVGRELFSTPWPPDGLWVPGDVTIGGASLLIRDEPGRGSEILARARDEAIELPAEGVSGLPTQVGAALTLHNPRTGEMERFELPAEGWVRRDAKGNERDGFVFRGERSLDRGCFVVDLSLGRLRAHCGGPVAGFTLNEKHQEELALELSVGDGLRYCMRFDDVLTDTGVTRKRPGRFEAKQAPAPQGCLAPH